MKFHQGIMDTIEDLTNTNNGIVKQQHVGLTKKNQVVSLSNKTSPMKLIIWGFPEIGVPHFIIHFHWISDHKPSSY